MMLCHVLVADDRELGARAQPSDPLAQRRKLAAADHDVIAALPQRNLNNRGIAASQRRGHGMPPSARSFEVVVGCNSWSPSAAMISSTILSCGTSRDCTVRSASA